MTGINASGPLDREFRASFTARDLSVHRIGRQIDLAWPRDRSFIDENLLEEVFILQGCECAGQFFCAQMHKPFHSVPESDE
jgi:hypothetical protein